MPSDAHLTVAHVSTSRDFYGGELQAYLLLRWLCEHGHRCVTYARRGGEFARRLHNEGFDVETFRGNGRDPYSVWRLRRRLAALKPDIVSFHDAHALTSGGLAALGLDIGARVAARRSQYLPRFAAKYRYLCDLVIAVSEAIAESCYAGGVPKNQVCVVYDGVDPGRAQSGSRERGRRSLAVEKDDRLFVVVASLERAKGHTDLLQALPCVFGKYPQARVVLAGDGSLRESLVNEARRLGIGDRVGFLGYRDDVPDLLHAADLFILPSRVESLGSSIIDAMFARVPIVTTITGGIPELVGPKNPEPAVAFLAPAGDPAALAEAILEALGSPQRCSRMVEQAETRALRRFTADTMIRETVSLYCELVDGRRGVAVSS